ncbi:MAG: hypothetical protein PWQ37_1941 [Candidatus Petromonas sp.]|jgi:hypothetical protein|nr:hypothetical protein [Candidatus Petromonas sp.]
MSVNSELGDTPPNIGGYIHYNALENAEVIKLCNSVEPSHEELL